MASTMAIRLDARTREELTRVARRRRETVSAAMRQAIALLIEQDKEALVSEPYLAIADLVGTVDGGDARRSSGGGRRVAAMLQARQRSRGARRQR
jgi:hypothetical protein